MTQDDFKLFTGETNTLDSDSWDRVVAVASSRLASFLCLEQYPDNPEDDLLMLLANFICAVLRFQGNPEPTVASKSVRNFSVSFSQETAANAFEQVAANYGDIIDKYSACEIGFTVEAPYWECPDERL